MPRFQHVDPTGRLQFWVADAEVTVTGQPVEVTDTQLVRFLEGCPFVKNADDKPAKKGSE